MIKGKNEKYSDEELVSMIEQGVLNGDDYIGTAEMKVWIKIKDTIYQFYLKEDANETL